MSNIQITLPDGSQQSVAAGTAPIDIAKSISPRLADAAIVAKVNGELYDLTRPLETDASLQILTNKDAEALEVYRHSTAHLLAAAVLEHPALQLVPTGALALAAQHAQVAKGRVLALEEAAELRGGKRQTPLSPLRSAAEAHGRMMASAKRRRKARRELVGREAGVCGWSQPRWLERRRG